MSIGQLAGGLASLRDSLRRLAAETDHEAVAVRAIQARIRTNELVKRLAGLASGDPGPLADRALTMSAHVSLVDADDSATSQAVLDDVEAVLGDIEDWVRSVGVPTDV